MNPRTGRILWILTIAWALSLMLGSIALLRGWNRPLPKGTVGYIVGYSPTVYLREGPSGTSRVVSLLERGREVEILSSRMVQDVDWMHIEVNGLQGWVPAANVGLDSPVENRG